MRTKVTARAKVMQVMSRHGMTMMNDRPIGLPLQYGAVTAASYTIPPQSYQCCSQYWHRGSSCTFVRRR